MMNIGDKRLNQRGTNLLSSMTKNQAVVLRQLGNRNEEVGYGRFLRNPKVTPQKIASSAIAKTSKATVGKHVLWLNDTSTMSYGQDPTVGSMPPVGKGNDLAQGFYLHPALGLNAADGTCLGLGSVQLFERTVYEAKDHRSTAKGRAQWRRKAKLKEKESYRWLDIPLQAVKNNPSATRHTIIGDQESAIYEVMSGLILTKKVDFLFRAAHDRLIIDLGFRHLRAYLKDKEVGHNFELKLPKTAKRSAHTASLDVRWSKIKLKRSEHGGGTKELPKHLNINVVQVHERTESVVGKEKPIHWMLLTSHPVHNWQDAQRIIEWYTWRWVIEQFFRSMKAKGLDIENAQVETVAALHNLSIATLCSAIMIMQLIQARDGQNDMNMAEVFNPSEIELIHQLNSKLEGNTEKLKNPHLRDHLAFASWVIARLGGWSGYQSQRAAGPKDMKNGLKKFYDILWYRDNFT